MVGIFPNGVSNGERRREGGEKKEHHLKDGRLVGCWGKIGVNLKFSGGKNTKFGGKKIYEHKIGMGEINIEN
jgi:hypothetical protein